MQQLDEFPGNNSGIIQNRIILKEKVNPKSLHSLHSIHITLLKLQNFRNVEHISGWHGLVMG